MRFCRHSKVNQVTTSVCIPGCCSSFEIMYAGFGAVSFCSGSMACRKRNDSDALYSTFLLLMLERYLSGMFFFCLFVLSLLPLLHASCIQLQFGLDVSNYGENKFGRSAV